MSSDRTANRRTVIGGTVALAGLGMASATEAAVGDLRLGPIVETADGKVRGYVAEGIHTFRGLRYGAPTGGANRFKPPVRPTPWTGVMETLVAGGGFIAPQVLPTGRGPDPYSSEILPDAPPMSEDCLFLNLFTPGVDGARRPVMVFLHGGAWSTGSGTAALFDGVRLAGRGDTVIVSINHRLNLFGFLYLADLLGPDYADSGNAGVLDIIAALRWVKDNIAAFGGDPGNVTLFGWSSGGSEVSQILAMPAADGLIHKAIVQSGSILTLRTRETAAKAAEGVLTRLGLDKSQARTLLDLPMEALLKGGGGGAPTFDGRSVPRQPWQPDAPPMTARIPMIIGGADSELSASMDDAALAMDDKTLNTRLQRVLGDQAAPVIAAYRAGYPNATPGQIFVFIVTGLWTTKRCVQQAERKAMQGGAPVYMYQWRWRSPLFGGKYMSQHGVDLPFVWDNVAAGEHRVGKGPGHQALADRMSRRWLAFARTGSPNAPGLERWDAYDVRRRATLVIDTKDRLVDDPDQAARLALEKLPQRASDGALGALRA